MADKVIDLTNGVPEDFAIRSSKGGQQNARMPDSEFQKLKVVLGQKVFYGSTPITFSNGVEQTVQEYINWYRTSPEVKDKTGFDKMTDRELLSEIVNRASKTREERIKRGVMPTEDVIAGRTGS